MTLPVGADIESLCSKCGDVWHVVVAKVGDKIVKVQCKQCGGLHRLKPVRPEPKPAPAPRRSAASSRQSAVGRGRPAPVREPVGPDPSKPSQPYRPSVCFAVGDQVQHPTFGLGLVEEVPAPGKMQVRFATGRKLLVHGRPAAAE